MVWCPVSRMRACLYTQQSVYTRHPHVHPSSNQPSDIRTSTSSRTAASFTSNSRAGPDRYCAGSNSCMLTSALAREMGSLFSCCGLVVGWCGWGCMRKCVGVLLGIVRVWIAHINTYKRNHKANTQAPTPPTGSHLEPPRNVRQGLALLEHIPRNARPAVPVGALPEQGQEREDGLLDLLPLLLALLRQIDGHLFFWVVVFGGCFVVGFWGRGSGEERKGREARRPDTNMHAIHTNTRHARARTSYNAKSPISEVKPAASALASPCRFR